MKTYTVSAELRVVAANGDAARDAVQSFMVKALESPSGLVLAEAEPPIVIRPIHGWCDEDVKAAYIEAVCDLVSNGNCECMLPLVTPDFHDPAPWDALTPEERDAMLEDAAIALQDDMTAWDMVQEVTAEWAVRLTDSKEVLS